MNTEELHNTYISLVKKRGMHSGNEKAFIEMAEQNYQYVKSGKMKFEDYHEYMNEQISNLRTAIAQSKKQKEQDSKKQSE